jgi:ABC-type transport system substrate-binding protein
MNMKNADLPWKKDQRIRQAIYRFTNRDQINEFAQGNEADLIVGTLPAALSEYQLDPKESDPFYKSDLKEAKQLFDAAGYDYSQEWELIPFGGIPGSTNEQTAIVWQNQAEAAGFKMRVNASLPISELLSNVIANAKFNFFTSSSPGSNDPSYVLRMYHTDALSQFNHFGLHDPAIDALIEKAESAYDHQENIKIVKQTQLEILKKYGSVMGIYAPKYRVLYNSKLQNYDIRPVPSPKYNTGVWLKA